MRIFLSSLKDNNTKGNGGVSLTFDDYTRTESWVNYHNNYGKARGWKASFFINNGNATVLGRYQYLFSEGHTMENHTTTHYDGVNDFIDGGGTPEEYYDTWLKPLDDWLVSNGIDHPKSFRFPVNITNQSVTDYLLNNNLYNNVSVGLGGYLDSMFEQPFSCVYKHDRYPEALKFDVNVGDYDPSFFFELLDYARDTNQIVVFFGHTIGNTGDTASWVDIDFLNSICDYVNDNEMNYYHIGELK